MIDGRKLSNTVGAVLDPIFALRRRVRIAPGAVARISFWTMAASTRETLLDIVDKHRDATAFSRATTLAWTQAQVQLHHLGVTTGEASLFQRLASHVLYVNPTLRPPSGMILHGAGAQSGLWALGVSGDLPIVLLRISDADDLDIARELLQAHEYWRMKQLAVDLVILNERQSSYVQDLQIALETLIRTRQMRPRIRGEDSAGRRLRAARRPHSRRDSALLVSVARVVLVAQRGRLFAQLDRIVETQTLIKPPASLPAKPDAAGRTRPAGRKTRIFQRARRLRQRRHGICDDPRARPSDAGALDQRHRERELSASRRRPRAAATLGRSTAARTSSRRGRTIPSSDRPGEAFYLRDDDTGEFWSPTALPIRDRGGDLFARHGRGYSRFEHTSHGSNPNFCNSCRSTPRSKYRV